MTTIGGQGLSTQLETMGSAAATVDRTADDIAGQLASIRARVDELAGAWRGQAQVAFAGIMADWDAESRKLDEALRGIATSIRSNRTQFDAAEQDNVSALSRAAGAGPLAL